MNDAIDLWRRCTETLREQVPEAAWQTSLASLSPCTGVDDIPGPFGSRDVAQGPDRRPRYLRLISAAASKAAEHPVEVILEVVSCGQRPVSQFTSDSSTNDLGRLLPLLPPDLIRAPRSTACRTSTTIEPRRFAPSTPRTSRNDSAQVAQVRHRGPRRFAPTARRIGATLAPERARPSKSVPGIDPRDTFDAFVIGSSNRFAHAAALSVAEDPGHNYNPLFIHGDAGLGKTHLLHAIGNYVCSNFPRHRVKYITTEAFMNEFVYAIRSNSTMEFKRRYREECDVLLSTTSSSWPGRSSSKRSSSIRSTNFSVRRSRSSSHRTDLRR